MNDDIRRLITQTPFEEVRRFVAERATCGKCYFWHDKQFCTIYSTRNPNWGCNDWQLEDQPRTDIEAT